MTFDDVVAVLTAHPLTASAGGTVICDSCHRYLGDPTQHLLDALKTALDEPVVDETTKPGVRVPERWDRPIGGEGT